jgi:hypothetical protein
MVRRSAAFGLHLCVGAQKLVVTTNDAAGNDPANQAKWIVLASTWLFRPEVPRRDQCSQAADRVVGVAERVILVGGSDDGNDGAENIFDIMFIAPLPQTAFL